MVTDPGPDDLPVRHPADGSQPLRKIDLTNIQVATSETARQINRRIVLNLLRRHQPMSRADLARRSGLQRSTVSAIVDQLIEEGWVTEGEAGRSVRGRRPRFLHLNADRAGVIGVELRPESTTIGLAGIDARFLAQTSLPTPRDPDVFVRELARATALVRSAHPAVRCDGMGISLPGRVDGRGRIVFAPNLGWNGVDLRAKLEAAINLPVMLENAASACALAELWFGHHPEQVRNIIAVTVSEGVGVGLLLNGQLVNAAGSMAGEFGHVSLDDTGPPCRCGRCGCWERYASNSAAVQYYWQRRGGAARPSERDMMNANRQYDALAELLREGDPLARETIERQARYLGIGLAVLVTGLSPDVIAIVGEITGMWDCVGPIVESTIAARALPHAAVRVVPTDRADQPRLRGAVTLVVQQHFGAPV